MPRRHKDCLEIPISYYGEPVIGNDAISVETHSDFKIRYVHGDLAQLAELLKRGQHQAFIDLFKDIAGHSNDNRASWRMREHGKGRDIRWIKIFDIWNTRRAATAADWAEDLVTAKHYEKEEKSHDSGLKRYEHDMKRYDNAMKHYGSLREHDDGARNDYDNANQTHSRGRRKKYLDNHPKGPKQQFRSAGRAMSHGSGDKHSHDHQKDRDHGYYSYYYHHEKDHDLVDYPVGDLKSAIKSRR